MDYLNHDTFITINHRVIDESKNLGKNDVRYFY